MIKKRLSESTVKPKLVEYLQGGILIRFNATKATKDKQTFYKYDEFWFEKTATVKEIETEVVSKGFILTASHKSLIV